MKRRHRGDTGHRAHADISLVISIVSCVNRSVLRICNSLRRHVLALSRADHQSDGNQCEFCMIRIIKLHPRIQVIFWMAPKALCSRSHIKNAEMCTSM